MTNTKTPIHLEYILGLTAFAAGSVDVISFVKLGGVFASAMTGNLAFLALYLARGSFHAAIGSLIALIGFILGGAIGTLQTRGKNNHHALNILLATEAALLLAIIILWLPTTHIVGGWATDMLILTLSITMGLQSIIGKKVNLSNIPTVVFTSTLTNMVIAITDSLASGKFSLPTDTKRQSASFTLYFVGALTAGILATLDSQVIIALPFAAVTWALVRHLRAEPE
ncbi:MAG: YoaK family protein [Acidocella sp.]|nr:YoaK family protein [Acidocella sp.]